MINVAVCGANGKMGQEVVRAVNSAWVGSEKLQSIVGMYVVFRRQH